MEARTRFSVTDLSINRLSDKDDLKGFSCGVPELDSFFHDDARLCMKYKYVSVYVVRWKDEIVSLFTLTNDSVLFASEQDKNDFLEDLCDIFNEEYKDVFIQQSAFPAINIGHLATKKEMQGLGIGTSIIYFVANTFLGYDMAGCQFITVDSLNNQATNKFYLKNGFSFQTDNDAYNQTRRMYLPLKMFEV